MSSRLYILLWIPWLAGCQPKVEDVEPLWAAEAEATCEKYESCSDGYATRYYGSVAACVARVEAVHRLDASTPGVLITPDQLKACAAEIDADTCDQWNGHPDTACFYSGELANGTACLTSWECASAFCLHREGSECGTCAPRLQEGDPCLGNCYPSDLLCVTPAGGGAAVCVARRSEGAACDAGTPCNNGLACMGAASGSGTCQPVARTKGAACDDDVGPLCDQEAGLVCDNHLCVTAPIVAAGEACAGPTGLLVGVCSGAVCARMSGQLSATCLPITPDGASCATQTCLAPAACSYELGQTPSEAVCRLEMTNDCSGGS